MKLLFLLPILLSSLSTYAGNSDKALIRRASNSFAAEQLYQFDLNDFDYIGISSSSVCSGDIGIEGFSCVSADLRGIGISTLTIPLQYQSSRILTMSDDKAAEDVFVYVFRHGDDVNRDYSKISMTLNADSFYDIHLPGEDTSLFKNYDITPVSMTSDYSIVKYRIDGLSVDWTQDEREYVIREVIDWNDRTSEHSILQSGMVYGVKNSGSNIEVVQNSLNVYTAKQLLVESYIHIADATGLPLNYDSRIQGQSILLFDIYKNGDLFLNKLRAVELQASYYQWFGALNINIDWNTERGSEVVHDMIEDNWKSGEEGTLVENFHQKHIRHNASLIISPSSHTVDYKPSFWHWWHTKSYSWNDLDFTKNLDRANKHIDNSLLNDYTYYAVLKTFDFEISPTGYKALDGVTYWQITDRSDGYLPYTFTDVSLASFWYEEGEKVKQGIVMSTYNNSYGTVVLVNVNDNALPDWLKLVIGGVALIALLIIFSILGFIVPIFKGLFLLVKYFFLAIFWLISTPFKLLGWLFTRKKKTNQVPANSNYNSPRKKNRRRK